jgi:hypothetical protein
MKILTDSFPKYCMAKYRPQRVTPAITGNYTASLHPIYSIPEEDVDLST